MKNAFKSLKENLVSLIGGTTMAKVLLLGVILLVAWALGWVMGHLGAGIVMVFDNSAYGLHGGDLGQVMASVVGVAGVGQHIVGEPLTTELTASTTPGLLRNEIDEKIVKIHPMSTPLDQISRFGGSRRSGSMKVEYYSVDTKPVEAQLKNDVDYENRQDDGTVLIQTTNDAIFQPTTTIMLPQAPKVKGGTMVMYVVDNSSEGVRVKVVNGDDGFTRINKGTGLVRMGRAAAELDVMTSQYEVLPTKKDNYCQIFKAQVEQSTLMKIANKEVGWSFTDQEEAAIIDMRMGMEMNFLFGNKMRFTDPLKGQEVFLTGGIWNQTTNRFEYDEEDEINEQWLVKLCRQAFSNNAGSTRKVLLAGSELIEKLHLCGVQRVMTAEASVTKWGLDFSEIHSKFGTLYVMLAEVFDKCDMAKCGMVIDPEYVVKYTHIPFRTERLNLRQSGLRNVDAVVITEASCLVLRYPEAHMQITCA